MSAVEGVTVIVPVKPWALAKSRLDVGSAARENLARAFVLDVIDTVAGSAVAGRLVLVTAESELRAVASRTGAIVVPDRPLLSANALNVAVDAGHWWAVRNRPEHPVVVVPADLPALTSNTFDHALSRLAEHDRAFVPDASGEGTTLVWARSAQLLHTQYGPDSADHHERSGFVRTDAVSHRVRRDVDTRSDLAGARLLGVGAHTSAAVEEIVAGRLLRTSAVNHRPGRRTGSLAR